jgi:hypothetical protein
MLSVSFIRSEEYWKMGTKSGGVAFSIQHDGGPRDSELMTCHWLELRH